MMMPMSMLSSNPLRFCTVSSIVGVAPLLLLKLSLLLLLKIECVLKVPKHTSALDERQNVLLVCLHAW